MSGSTTVLQRRICWPDPDATCLEGGCIYCDDHPWRNYTTIEAYARRAGVVPNRGIGEKDAWSAWVYGLAHNFFNRDTREKIVQKQVRGLRGAAE